MRAIEKISCIYTITNLTNNKIYVGYTKNFYKRRNEHYLALLKGYHCNDYLQKAFNKYGETNIVIEILEECEERFLVALEHYWSTMLNTHNDKYGYNLQITNPNGNYKKSDKSIEKSTKSMIGRRWKLSPETLIRRQEKRKNIVISDELREKYRKLGKERPINWKTVEAMRNSRKGKKFPFKKKSPLTESHKESLRNRSYIKSIIQLDLQGNFVKEWRSAPEIKRQLNIDNSSILKACKNQKKNIVKGFKWIYKKDYKYE